MIPSPVWKSSYRLIFGTVNASTLEGWAMSTTRLMKIWSNVRLATGVGPANFVHQRLV